jgi:hypothetical protein
MAEGAGVVHLEFEHSDAPVVRAPPKLPNTRSE